MKKILISVTAFIAVSTSLVAQSATVSAGGETEGSGGSASYSIGQASFSYVENSDGSVTEGVQQSYEVLPLTSIDENGFLIQCTAFPNPVVDKLSLEIVKGEINDLSYQLCDLNGKQIRGSAISESNTQIDMAGLTAGTYMLHVLDDKQKTSVFKIVKN